MAKTKSPKSVPYHFSTLDYGVVIIGAIIGSSTIGGVVGGAIGGGIGGLIAAILRFVWNKIGELDVVD